MAVTSAMKITCAFIDAIGAGGVKGRLMRKELSDETVAEIKAMADIRIVDGRAELSNVREIYHVVICSNLRSGHLNMRS